MSSLYQIAFNFMSRLKNSIRFQCEHLFTQRQTVVQKPIRYVKIHCQHRRSAASLRYRNGAKIKPPFSCVNKKPIRCVFRAGVRAIPDIL